MVAATHAPSIASASLYHVHSYFIIPVNDGGWAWRPWTPLDQILAHTVERVVTTAHEPSLTPGHQSPSIVMSETAQTPAQGGTIHRVRRSYCR
eukprot:6150273-Prymnesium_polylepis.1